MSERTGAGERGMNGNRPVGESTGVTRTCRCEVGGWSSQQWARQQHLHVLGPTGGSEHLVALGSDRGAPAVVDDDGLARGERLLIDPKQVEETRQHRAVTADGRRLA